jgi:hypothetical protein
VCEAWSGWELPPLKKVGTCYRSNLSGETDATLDDLARMFEKKGFVRGRSGAGTMADNRSWSFFFKEGEPESYRLSFSSGSFVIGGTIPPRKEQFVIESDWRKLESFSSDVAAYVKGLQDVVAVFDAQDKAPSKCSDEDLTAREPQLAERTSRFLLNVDALAKKPETRRGVPDRLPLHDQKALDGEQPPQVLWARRAFDEIAPMRIVPAFRVLTYHEPGRAGDKSIKGGMVELSLAVIDLKERRALCRTTARGTTGEQVEYTVLTHHRDGKQLDNGTVIGDPVADGLSWNVEAAAFAALGAMNPKLQPSTRR